MFKQIDCDNLVQTTQRMVAEAFASPRAMEFGHRGGEDPNSRYAAPREGLNTIAYFQYASQNTGFSKNIPFCKLGRILFARLCKRVKREKIVS